MYLSISQYLIMNQFVGCDIRYLAFVDNSLLVLYYAYEVVVSSTLD